MSFGLLCVIKKKKVEDEGLDCKVELAAEEQILVQLISDFFSVDSGDGPPTSAISCPLTPLFLLWRSFFPSWQETLPVQCVLYWSRRSNQNRVKSNCCKVMEKSAEV